MGLGGVEPSLNRVGTCLLYQLSYSPLESFHRKKFQVYRIQDKFKLNLEI